MKLEVPDDMSQCTESELRMLMLATDSVRASARDQLQRRFRVADAEPQVAPTPAWALRVDAWLGAKRDRRTFSPWMLWIALAVALVMALPTLVPGVVSAYQTFKEAKASLEKPR
jgi:hypothetical protein